MADFPTTRELRAGFDVPASARGELEDIRNAARARRRLDPAIKLRGGKIVRGIAGQDTHRSLAAKIGIDLDNTTKVVGEGFFDKRNQKFIGRQKAFLKFGTLDALELFDPRAIVPRASAFGAGIFGDVGARLFEMINGPLVRDRPDFEPTEEERLFHKKAFDTEPVAGLERGFLSDRARLRG